MVSAFPPTVDTSQVYNPNHDSGVSERSGTDNALAASVIALQNALINGTLNKRTFRFTYDFATHGGAVGAITLTARDGALPNNFIIQNAFLDVLTAFTTAAAGEGAVSTGQGAGDLVAATVVSGAPYSSTGRKVTIPLLGTIGTWIKTTAARSPTFTISVGAITAGKFNLFIEGYISD